MRLEAIHKELLCRKNSLDRNTVINSSQKSGQLLIYNPNTCNHHFGVLKKTHSMADTHYWINITLRILGYTEINEFEFIEVM